MLGVEGIEQRSCLGAAHFSEDDPVGTEPESVFQKGVEGDVSLERVRLRSGRHDVGFPNVKFRGILDYNDALVIGNEIGENPQKCSLARSRSTANKQRLSARNLFS